jgi:hypothetical protein
LLPNKLFYDCTGKNAEITKNKNEGQKIRENAQRVNLRPALLFILAVLAVLRLEPHSVGFRYAKNQKAFKTYPGAKKTFFRIFITNFLS